MRSKMTIEDIEKYRDNFSGHADNGDTIKKHVINGGVYYLRDSNGRVGGIFFEGSSVRPSYNYLFQSNDAREAFVRKWVADIEAKIRIKAERKAARLNDKHDYSLGSILVSSWGYEQTNVDWYQVVRVVSSKTVVIRKISGTIRSSGNMSGYSMPCRDEFIGDEITVRAGRNGFKVNHGHGGLWDGREMYTSSYA